MINVNNKYITRLQINNGFNIPKEIREKIVKNNTIAKWIIDKENRRVYLHFIKEKNKQDDNQTEKFKIIYRKVYQSKGLYLPKEVLNYLNCKQYYNIELNIIKSRKDYPIEIKCIKKHHISEISALFSYEEVNTIE